MPNFLFSNLVGMLRSSTLEPDVREFLELEDRMIVRDEYYGSIEYIDDGVEVVFKEAPWVVPPTEMKNKADLYISAFHMHRDGHDGYSGFVGPLLGGVMINDTENDIIRKVGQPDSVGGGSFSKLMNRTIPFWMKYSIENDILNLQLDDNRRLEMATVFAPDQTVI